MGIVCPCGFIIPNVSLPFVIEVRFFMGPEPQDRSGMITYDVNVCDNQFNQSFANFSFEDTSGQTPDRSFSFQSSFIDSVTCGTTAQGNCLIQISGMGLLDDETEEGEFFVFLSQSPNQPIVVTMSFVITDYAASAGNTEVFNTEDSDIEVYGCFS